MGGSTTDQRYISDENTFQEITQQKITKELNKKICIYRRCRWSQYSRAY